MAGYDKEKDKMLDEELVQNGMYKVAVFQYNGGKTKIGILMEKWNKGEVMYVPAKRVELDSAKAIHEALGKILERTQG